MRLQDYIIEEEKGLAYYIPKIQQECKPFLKDIKNAAGTLFRADGKSAGRPVWKKTIRKNRIPSDTDVDVSEGIDDLFYKKFGWKPRSQGLFCWPHFFDRGVVARMWMVFPVGNYKYIWSDTVDDLYPVVTSMEDNIINYEWEDTDHSEIVKTIIEEFENIYLNSYTDKKIKMAIKYGNEVMVGADHAYMIKPELIGPVNEMLGLNWQNAKFTGRKI